MPHAIDPERKQKPDVREAEEAERIAMAEDDRLRSLQRAWPERTRSWRQDPSDQHPEGLLLPGVFNGPSEFGILPRQKVLDGWNPSLDNVVPPFHPVCLSTRTADPAYNLTPIETDGWAYWVLPGQAVPRGDKAR
jgi:hypothetical protein